MELKFIDNPVRLQAFLNEPGNTENIVEPGHTYYIKPDAVYLGIYEGLVLAGVHEVRNFWHSVVECHAVYDPGFRGEYSPLQNCEYVSIVILPIRIYSGFACTS